jgi:hypothetical protein
MNRKVPVFATWLLHRFGVQRQNEALMGDLAEEYRAGKSHMWYWWQTLVAIWVTVVRDVREHKLLALRAVAMGWILAKAFIWLKYYVIFPFAPYYDHWGPPFRLAVVQVLILAQWVLLGWLVARAHRSHAAALALMVGVSRIFDIVLSDTYYSFVAPNLVKVYSPFAGLHIILKHLPGRSPLVVLLMITFVTQIVLIVAGGLLVKPEMGPEQPSTTIAQRVRQS